MEILILDRKKRIVLGKNGRKKIEKGRFSIKYRNNKLREIYEELLKS